MEPTLPSSIQQNCCPALDACVVAIWNRRYSEKSPFNPRAMRNLQIRHSRSIFMRVPSEKVVPSGGQRGAARTWLRPGGTAALMSTEQPKSSEMERRRRAVYAERRPEGATRQLMSLTDGRFVACLTFAGNFAGRPRAVEFSKESQVLLTGFEMCPAFTRPSHCQDRKSVV